MSTESIENYLKQIYELSLDHTPVKTSQLAEALEVSPAAVTEMVKRLEAQDLLVHRPYRGVTLTDAGRAQALEVLRRHRLWESFLHKVLGIPWSQVHTHACRLEHGTDRRLADALSEHLGHPAHDPHGDPIPGPGGEVDEPPRGRLSEVEPGHDAVVVQATNEDPELLAYLKGLGLVPGARVRVKEHAPFGGPITLELGGQDRVVGREAAATLLVGASSPVRGSS